MMDTREQRRQVLDTLRRHSAERLLVCCDARQTPDRGTLEQLKELALLSSAMGVVLLLPDTALARREQWQRQLLGAGLNARQIFLTAAAGLEWLTTGESTA